MKTLEQFPQIAKKFSQRKIFSLALTIFDPLRILSPLQLDENAFIASLGKKWDEPLPDELHSNLQRLLNNFFAGPDIQIPIWIKTSTNQENKHQFHVFVDASTVALAVLAYFSTQRQDESFQTSFLLGKCKVAPIKKTIVPKSEFEAAILVGT